MHADPRPVRLIVSDLDGCVTAGDSWGLDGALFDRLRDYAERAEVDPAVPRLTFNSGRPLPYVECMARHAHVTMPVLCEGGLLMYEPKTRSIRVHPDYRPEDHDRFAQLAALARKHVEAGELRFIHEPGKMAEFTLLPRNGATTSDLELIISEFAELAGGGVRIDRTHAVISLVPDRFSKGVGLKWLAEVTGIPTAEMAAIGDADVDWTFMSLAAASWAPANATPWLRERATVASDARPGEIVIEAIETIIAANRGVLARHAP
jgi:hydroxymethylpyrimidine pyrophosphatase-like HAD family hydrolase